MKVFKKGLTAILAAMMVVSAIPAHAVELAEVADTEQSQAKEIAEAAGTLEEEIVVAQKLDAGAFSLVGGACETIYAEISGMSKSAVTSVNYSGAMNGSLTGDDLTYLVRDIDGKVRIDIPGLKAGIYTLTVETTGGTYTAENINVVNYDRSGFAHFNYTEGVGAYKDDGTLKENAIVLYVTDENKNTVELTCGDKTVTGIGNILNSVGSDNGSGMTSKGGKPNTNANILQDLGKADIPLVVRFVGCVSDSGLYESGKFNMKAEEGLISGLTIYDSLDNGGTPGDNGHMARMKSGKNITLEGIGYDATIDGWGFHFMAETATADNVSQDGKVFSYKRDNTGLGRSFEVRNLKFINTPEDAIGMEGQQGLRKIDSKTGKPSTYGDSAVTSPLCASVQRCWIHNNEFYCPNIGSPAESDKAQGDGSVDFKRGEWFTCSYNYFEGCHKTNLVGSSDSSLQFNLTYHHNHWFRCEARGPLTRNANVHMYDNFFEETSGYAMNTRASAYIFSESNLFYMCKSPQAVQDGAVKSYNDAFDSVFYNLGKPGTQVDDKSEYVSNACQFQYWNVKFDKFDTDANLSYIPSGDYELQEDFDEMRKVVYANAGCLSENPVTKDQVTMDMISLCQVAPVTVNELPKTLTPGKLSKTQYAFTISGSENADLSLTYVPKSELDSAVLLTSSGMRINLIPDDKTANLYHAYSLKPGTYIIQPNNFQPGNPSTFKEITVDSITLEAADPNNHQHKYVVTTTPATCYADGKKVKACAICDESEEEIIPAAHKFGSSYEVESLPAGDTDGMRYYTCSVCGARKYYSIPAAGAYEGGASYNWSYDNASTEFTEKGTTSSAAAITYGGKNYGTAFTGTVDFTPSDKGILYVITASSNDGKAITINGESYTIEDNKMGNYVAFAELPEGEKCTIKTGDVPVYYIAFVPQDDSLAEYTVNVYLQKPGGSALIHNSENYDKQPPYIYTGKIGSTVTAVPAKIEGYEEPKASEYATVTVTADNKASIDYYYPRKIYTISFTDLGDCGTGRTFESIQVPYGAAITFPDTAKGGVEEFTFEGWYEDSAYTIPVNTDEPVLAKGFEGSSKEYFAHYIPFVHMYTLKIDYNYEGAPATVVRTRIKEGSSFANVKEVTKDEITRKYYSLAGLYTDKECTQALAYPVEVNADITVYAKWQLDITQLESEIAEGEKVTFKADNEWDYDTVNTASFNDEKSRSNQQKITTDVTSKDGKFIVHSGNYESSDYKTKSYMVVTANTSDIKSNAYKLGIKTYGVQTASSSNSNFRDVDKTIEFTPQKDATVSVVCNSGGSGTRNVTVGQLNASGAMTMVASKATASSVASYDFTVKGGEKYFVYASGGGGITIYEITIAYAPEVDNLKLVEFIVDGKEHAHKLVKAGEKVVAPAAPESGTAEFAGWYLDEAGTKAFDFDTAVGDDIRLFAKFEAVKVSFDMMGHGDQISPVDVTKGTRVTSPANPVCKGYIFNGWYKSNTFAEEDKWNFDTDVVSENITLYALWTKDESDPGTGSGEGGEGGEGGTPADPIVPGDADKYDYVEEYMTASSDYAEADCIALYNNKNTVVTIAKNSGYTGNNVRPKVTVAYTGGKKSVKLAEGIDYVLKYENNIAASKNAKVIIEGCGKYKTADADNVIAQNFTIAPRSIKKTKYVAASINNEEYKAATAGSGTTELKNLVKNKLYVFDGTKPLMGVSYDGRKESTGDFYVDSIVSTADTKIVAIVKGINNYGTTDEMKVTVPVDKAAKLISEVALEKTDYAYCAGKVTPKVVSVSSNDGIVLDSKMYSVAYKNNTDAGLGYVIVTGKKDYKGTVVKTFTITPSKQEITDVTKPNKALVYTGSYVKPAYKFKLTIKDAKGKDKTIALKKDKDYRVVYKNNLYSGTATISVTGIGNYAGSTYVDTFSVGTLDIKKAKISDANDVISVSYKNRELVENVDYTITKGAVSGTKTEITISACAGRDFTGSVVKKVKTTSLK